MIKFAVEATNAQGAINIGHELGLDLVSVDITEGYAESVMHAFKLVASDPFLQGIFFGTLLARNISIKFNDKDGLTITISNLKTLRKFLDHFK